MNKRVKKITSLLDKNKPMNIDEALMFFTGDYATSCKANFDETVEFVVQLKIDAKKSDQMVRGAVTMPNGLGKKVVIAAIVSQEAVDTAKSAGADFYGSEDIIEKIKNNKIDFDLCVATPDMMSKTAKIAKILGPKGLMPNPKTGTVSSDVTKMIENLKKGQVAFKIDKNAIVHTGVGKLSFKKEELKENIKSLYESIVAAKPEKIKGQYISKAYLSTTHGPSIKLLDLETIVS